MGRSLSMHTAFGFVVPGEGVEFPWDGDDYEGDPKEWWREVNGYKPLYQPYTDDGDYSPGWSRDDPRFGDYFQHRRDWLEANPMPFEVENAGVDDYTDTVLCVPGTLTNHWESSVELNAMDYLAPESVSVDAFWSCIEEHLPLLKGKKASWLMFARYW